MFRRSKGVSPLPQLIILTFLPLQVPCYSYGQKLSKLAILRIACNYILSLAQLAELDYSSNRSSLSFSQCVEQCTRTLQAEGRSKKRKVRLALTPEDVFTLIGSLQLNPI